MNSPMLKTSTMPLLEQSSMLPMGYSDEVTIVTRHSPPSYIFTQSQHSLSNNLLYDFLPSFEMHNALKHKKPAFHGRLPTYEEIDNPIELNSEASSNSSFFGISPASTFMSSRTIVGTEDPIKAGNDNIDIKVHIHCDDSSTPLHYKVLTSDDIITGYVTVQNKTMVPIYFGSFDVSLQGNYIIKADGKIFVKNFLNMIDPSASWSAFHVPNVTDPRCSNDGEVGLPIDRVLEPLVKYKTFFTFKLPKCCLDTTCQHGIENHTYLPPSLGFDPLKFPDAGPVADGGSNSLDGSSLVVLDDFSRGKMNVQYFISASLLDSQNEGHDRDDGDEEAAGDDFIMAEKLQPFRFMPTLPSIKVSPSDTASCFFDQFRDSLEYAKRTITGLETKKSQQLRSSNVDSSSCLSFGMEHFQIQKKVQFDNVSKIGLFKSKLGSLPHGELTISTETSVSFPSHISIPNERNEISSGSQIKLLLDFTPTESNSSPPIVESIKVGLLTKNVYTSSPTSIPIDFSPSIDTESIVKDAQDLLKKYQELKLQGDIDEYIPEDTIIKLETLKSLNVDSYQSYILDSNFIQEPWVGSKSEIKLDFKFNDDLTKTIIPSFQSCLMMRSYYLHLGIIFKGGKNLKMRVPAIVT